MLIHLFKKSLTGPNSNKKLQNYERLILGDYLYHDGTKQQPEAKKNYNYFKNIIIKWKNIPCTGER